LEVNGNCQLSGYRHSSKYILVYSRRKKLIGLEQHKGRSREFTGTEERSQNIQNPPKRK